MKPISAFDSISFLWLLPCISGHFLLEIFPLHSVFKCWSSSGFDSNALYIYLFFSLRSYCINSHGFKCHKLIIFIKITSLHQLSLLRSKPKASMSNYLRAPFVSFWFLKLKKTHVEFTTIPPQIYSSSTVFNNLHKWLYHSLLQEAWEASLKAAVSPIIHIQSNTAPQLYLLQMFLTYPSLFTCTVAVISVQVAMSCLDYNNSFQTTAHIHSCFSKIYCRVRSMWSL